MNAVNRYLTRMAGDAALTQLHELRSRALAVYLLIRQGQTATALLSAVHEQLKRDYPQAWKDDTIGMLLASSYALLQQAKPARELAQGGLARVGAAQPPKYGGYAYYYDASIDTARRNGRISKITSVDGTNLTLLGFLFAQQCTVVRGK